MSRAVLLDSGPLGTIAHPRADPAIVTWVNSLMAAGIRWIIPEIADYEVRRELLRANKLFAHRSPPPGAADRLAFIQEARPWERSA